MKHRNTHTNDRAAGCQGKQGWSNAHQARAALTRGNRNKGQSLNTYKCLCGMVHIGTNSRH